MDDEELAAWLRLLLTPGLGPMSQRKLLAAFGLPPQVFASSPAELGTLCSPAQVRALREPPAGLDALAARTRTWLDEGHTPDGPTRRLITLADPDYPPALLETADPPLLLHAWGAPLARGPLNWPAMVAMVGSRNATPQGLANARAFARHLAGAGWPVVSGLALGIDGAAHEGALDGTLEGASGQAAQAWATVAVLGTGLDRLYPRQHAALAARIAGQGLVLSEFALGTPPLQENFPRRNRIIAGLSRGTLVVEAAPQSGSLVTARLAAEMGREVFAIPGSIHAPQSRGCHALLRQGAKLVETAQDVLEELGEPSPPPRPGPEAAASFARVPQPAEDAVLAALSWTSASLDELADRTGLPTALLQARLLELELDGQVGRLPGGLFQRIAKA